MLADQSFDQCFGAIMVQVADRAGHARQRVLFHGNILLDRIRIRLHQHLHPLLRFSESVVRVEQVNGFLQKIPVRLFDDDLLVRLLREHSRITVLRQPDLPQVRPEGVGAVQTFRDDPSAHDVHVQALVDDAPERDEILLVGFLQPDHRPVNRARFRQPPLHRAVQLVRLFHHGGIHLQLVAEELDALTRLRGLRVEQLVVVRPAATEHARDFLRPLVFIDEMRIIEVLPHLVLEEPGELAVEQRLLGIIADALIAQQLDALLHPAPAVVGIAELDRDVVGHVPALHEPDLDERRFQLGNPVGELHLLEILVLLLQVACANPERIRDQATKPAQRHRRKRQHRRRVLQRRHARQAQI